MRGYRDMIGSTRTSSLLLGVSMLGLLSGCGLFGSGGPTTSEKARPGAERAIAASGNLPAASSGRQYEPGIAPIDETRTGPQIGSVVAARGGQRAQQEAIAKAAAERDAKAREERQQADAERKAKEASAKPGGPSTPIPQPQREQAATPIPQPTPPVTATPIPPPSATPAVAEPTSAPAPVAVASAPARRVDPNKAFEPPPGWVPPGQNAPAPTASARPTAVATAAAPPPAPMPVAAPPAPLPPAPTVTTAAAAPPPLPPAPTPAARTPGRRADPNKAFEPPPGWVPPGQTAPVAVATAAAPPPPAPAAVAAPPPLPPAPSVTTAAAAPAPLPPAPTPAARAPTRRADQNRAFEPPPGWTPPASAPAVAAAAPPPAAPPPPPAPVITAATPPPAAPVVAAPAPAPAPEPVAIVQADIPSARSGSVPFTALKSPPFGGPMQVAVIQFGRSSSGLGGIDDSVLQRVAQIYKRNGGTVRVVAHASQDATASSVEAIERGNYDVSRRRALAIANRLMALGVPRTAIIAEAASDSEPVYETSTARGVAANRRAEVFLDL